jgi:hypothetical protein
MTGEMEDANDGKDWSEMDMTDLKQQAAGGQSLESVARFLCRSGTTGEVRGKAEELGLQFRGK